MAALQCHMLGGQHHTTQEHWVSMGTMRIVTAICLALCALELVFLHKNPTGIRKSIVRQMPGILVCLVGLCTIVVYAIRKITGEEPSMETSPFLNLFLTPDTRMALLTAIHFLIVGGACRSSLSVVAVLQTSPMPSRPLRT